MHDIVERNGAGKLSREDAFVEFAAVARDFASQASSAELGSTTLQEIASRSQAPWQVIRGATVSRCCARP